MRLELTELFNNIVVVTSLYRWYMRWCPEQFVDDATRRNPRIVHDWPPPPPDFARQIRALTNVKNDVTIVTACVGLA